MLNVVLRDIGDDDLHPLIAVQCNRITGSDAEQGGKLFGEDHSIIRQRHGSIFGAVPQVDQGLQRLLIRSHHKRGIYRIFLCLC